MRVRIAQAGSSGAAAATDGSGAAAATDGGKAVTTASAALVTTGAPGAAHPQRSLQKKFVNSSQDLLETAKIKGAHASTEEQAEKLGLAACLKAACVTLSDAQIAAAVAFCREEGATSLEDVYRHELVDELFGAIKGNGKGTVGRVAEGKLRAEIKKISMHPVEAAVGWFSDVMKTGMKLLRPVATETGELSERAGMKNKKK